MRGGITSGIVYPLAVAELDKTYDFRSIGGTSAGAIAAAVTAAAAYGRVNGNESSFSLVKGIPEQLGQKNGHGTFLENLFQPQRGTVRLFRIVKAVIAAAPSKGALDKIRPIVIELARTYFWQSVPGAIPGLAIMAGTVLFTWWLSPAAWYVYGLAVLSFLSGLLSGVVGLLLFAVYRTQQDAVGNLHENMYGLCSGLDGEGAPQNAPALTPWLHDIIQRAAGLPPDKPLTIGHLGHPLAEEPPPTPLTDKETGVELQLMTTNITLGLPRMFPFLEPEGDEVYFNVEELKRLLPSPVVTHMVRVGRRKGTIPLNLADADLPKFCRLPDPSDMPVLFGARLSLSFPILLSAIPLYHLDHSASADDGSPLLRCCWYSDGGLTSNFPVHMFDSPIPMRPTFGINLAPATMSNEDMNRYGEMWQYVSMPERNGEAPQARFNLFDQRGNSQDPTKRTSSIGGFLSALFDTARNWQDSRLMAMPGYQDRIVTVHLKDGQEGGYRLDMEDTIINRVGKRGQAAAELLAARFSGQTSTDPRTGQTIELDWENHRRVRLRATLAALETYSRDLSARWKREDVPEPATASYKEAAKRRQGSYPFGDNDRTAAALQQVRRLMATFDKLPNRPVFDNPDGTTADGRAPQPKAELRLRPPDR
jgi:predicted acylesterase/phospholipase RssA